MGGGDSRWRPRSRKISVELTIMHTALSGVSWDLDGKETWPVCQWDEYDCPAQDIVW